MYKNIVVGGIFSSNKDLVLLIKGMFQSKELLE